MVHYESQPAGKPERAEFLTWPMASMVLSVGLQALAVYAAVRYLLVSLLPLQQPAGQEILSVMAAVAYGVFAVMAYPRRSADRGIAYQVAPEMIAFATGQRVQAVKPLFPVQKGTLGTVTGKDVKKRHSRNGDRYFVTWDGGVGLAVKPTEIAKIG